MGGDLLLNPTTDQLIATRFLRNAPPNFEDAIDYDAVSKTKRFADTSSDHWDGFPGSHVGVCTLPRPQVRFGYPARVLPNPFLFQQHGRDHDSSRARKSSTARFFNCRSRRPAAHRFEAIALPFRSESGVYLTALSHSAHRPSFVFARQVSPACQLRPKLHRKFGRAIFAPALKVLSKRPAEF